MPLLIVLALIVFAIVALVPLSIVMRYRVGTSRRRARRWIVTLNAAGVGISAFLFLIAAAMTNIWVSDAFAYTAMGLAAGCVLGALGLWLIDPSFGIDVALSIERRLGRRGPDVWGPAAEAGIFVRF